MPSSASPFANFGGFNPSGSPVASNLPGHDDAALPSNYNLHRRTSVSAESLTPTSASQDSWSPPFHQKPREQLERLRKAVSTNFLFAHLAEEQSSQVLGALQERTIPKAGIKVITQGDVGDYFYVVESGSCDVHVNPSGKLEPGPDGMGNKVTTVGPGGSFGELALMYNAPRAATVMSAEPCTLWALDRVTFRRILMDAAFARRRMYENFLSEVPLLQTLLPYERSKIADALETVKYKKGDVVIQEGEPGENFFILEDGIAEVYRDDTEGCVKTYGKGVGLVSKDNQFPKFETYREQIDGKYWFPTYTHADDTLHFPNGQNQRIRMTVKYQDYKKFEGKSTITYGKPVEDTPPPPKKKQ